MSRGLAAALYGWGPCQMHDVRLEKWLADVLIAIGEPGLVANDLLPWEWKRTGGPAYRPHFDTT